MKEYEFTGEQKIINVHFLALIGIGLIILAFMMWPMIKPDKVKINTSVNNSNISTIVITEYVTVTVTPTPDGRLYFANEYESGVRKIKRPFSWFREDVSGTKDMSVHVTAYNYRVMNFYNWFNPQDYKYYKQFASENNKYVFVFIQIYMDDIIGQDSRMWLPDEKHYALQVNSRLYYPIEFQKQLRIKELEETFNLNDDSRVSYYGTLRTYKKGHIETAGETTENLTYLYGGKSNAVDGYLVYEIPENTTDEELILTASFNAFGNSAWILKPQNNGDYQPY